MKTTFITIALFLSLGCSAQITSDGVKYENHTITLDCSTVKAAGLLADKVKAKDNTTFYNAGNPCLVVVWSSDGYEVTGVNPELVLFTSDKITDVRRFVKGYFVDLLK